MKRTIVIIFGTFILAAQLFATTLVSASKKVNAEATINLAPVATSSTEIVQESTLWSKKDLYLSTNFIDLSQGNGNISGDVFINDKISANFSFRTASVREKVKDPENSNNTIKLAVDRSAYILGASFFPMGSSKKVNLLINPGLAFGSKKSPLDVENQTGISLKISALIRPVDKIGFEVGLKGSNLEEGSFTTDLYAGLGLLL